MPRFMIIVKATRESEAGVMPPEYFAQSPALDTFHELRDRGLGNGAKAAAKGA